MRLFLSIFLLVGVNLATLAQKVSISGVLTDSIGTPLGSATILLLNPRDSTLLNFTTSGEQGRFNLAAVPLRPYLLKISYVGFLPMTESIFPEGRGESIDLGTLVLKEATEQLGEIVVESERAPVVIKKDTIEFNAPSFKTQENAVVEDLLKKLPGVEVDNDGTIRTQGQKVQRVTVDGKPFFGSDPKLATRNLPADAVSKVQIFDKKSDQAQFTGIDDGQKEKTINLELKDEKRKGAFGNLGGGVGTDWRYSAKASINKFRKANQLSFLGMGNNVNEQGFGIEEYMNFTGNSQRMLSGRGAVRVEINDNEETGIPLNVGDRPTGIMKSYAAGVNFNRELNKSTEVNASYFYNHLDHDIKENLLRRNYFNLTVFDFNQVSVQLNKNDNHRLNVVVDHKIDSMNSIRVTTNASYNYSENESNSVAGLWNVLNAPVNTSETYSTNAGTTSRLNATALWRHRFRKKGRTFSLNAQFTDVTSDRHGVLGSRLWTRESGDSTLSQKNSQQVANAMYSVTSSYTEPLGKRKYLEFNYTFRQNDNTFSRSVFDLKTDQEITNTALSNDYKSSFFYHRAGVNFKINRKKFNATVGSGFQKAELTGVFQSNDVRIAKDFESIVPSASFNYYFGDTKSLEFRYETNIEEPTIQQLQPVVDNSDPLNLYVGNPNLKPSYVQNFELNYNTFNPFSFVSFFTAVDASFVRNAITISQNINLDGIRMTQPVNVNDYKEIRIHASVGFPITSLKSRVGIGSNMRYQQGSSLINEIANRTIQNTIGGRVRYDWRHNDFLNVALMTNISRQTADFELKTQQDQSFFNNVYGVESNLNFLKSFTCTASIEVLDYRNRNANYHRVVPLLNLSVSKFLLKGKSGELKLSANNILDRNVGITQSTGLNYLESRETNSLGRYFMLSFIYALNKQLNPMGVRPRGGVMRIIR